jgi:hypothetical protein
MNIVTKTILTGVLASGTLAANVHATDYYAEAQCEAQVSSVYRDAETMEFVGERRFRDGTKMNYAVHSSDPETGYTKTRMAVCWLGNENLQAYASEDGKTMVADIDVEGALESAISAVE